jgi:hypothetical protein
MTDTQTTSAEPKKNPLMKKIFIGIGIIFGLLGIDHFSTKWVSGGATITVTDSTIVVSPIVDTIVATPLVVDTAKKDTTK